MYCKHRMITFSFYEFSQLLHQKRVIKKVFPGLKTLKCTTERLIYTEKRVSLICDQRNIFFELKKVLSIKKKFL